MEAKLREQLKTIKNLTEIALILRNVERDDLLPTVIELLFLEAQGLIDNYCVVKE